jgi:hypothetical protein
MPGTEVATRAEVVFSVIGMDGVVLAEGELKAARIMVSKRVIS